VEGSWEHGNESSDSIKSLEVLEWLHDWRLFKKGSDLKALVREAGTVKLPEKLIHKCVGMPVKQD
jgi:hypothetical protein